MSNRGSIAAAEDWRRDARAVACGSFALAAYVFSETTVCSWAFRTGVESNAYSRIHGPAETLVSKPAGITRYAPRAALRYLDRASETRVAARVNACAATACTIPDSHGAFPPPKGK